MVLNCSLFDLIAIDLMSIVHMDEIWVEIAKKILNADVRGGGGSPVISDTPGRGGRGSEKG